MRILFFFLLVFASISSASASPCYVTDPSGSPYFCGSGTVSIGYNSHFLANEPYTITVSAGGLGPIAFDANDFTLAGATFSLVDFKSGDAGFVATYSAFFTVPGEYFYLPFFLGDRYGNPVCIGAANGPGCSAATYFVDQSVATSVPEPSTWAMLLIGFAVISVAIRRRNQKLKTPIRTLLAIHGGTV